MYKQARKGDVCDHGAVIITNSGIRFDNDRGVARKGDLVNCPIPGHGINPIIATVAMPLVISDGKPTAHICSITACGAKIITGSPETHCDK